MSQSSKRRRKVRLETPASVVLTRSDWIRLFCVMVGVGAVLLGWLVFEFQYSHDVSLRNTLSRWRAEYHLSEAQERLIRTEEERFHGSANPLTRPKRTPEEAEEHRLAVGHLMNPEDGARFLAKSKPVTFSSTNQAPNVTSETSHP